MCRDHPPQKAPSPLVQACHPLQQSCLQKLLGNCLHWHMQHNLSPHPNPCESLSSSRYDTRCPTYENTCRSQAIIELRILSLTYPSLQALFVAFLPRDVGGSICVEVSCEYDQVICPTFGCLLFNVLACRLYLQKSCIQSSNLKEDISLRFY